ncbi:MAG: hypothetical protein GY737_05715 [Desulfobacteraceae bacterium]|nr:hypothetical protein [Desulfobacteraceae bacterium]
MGVFFNKSDFASSRYLGDYYGLIFKDEHFILLTKTKEGALSVDSARLQKFNTCGIYCLLFALGISVDPSHAKFAYQQLLHRSEVDDNKKIINDLLIVETIQSILDAWND